MVTCYVCEETVPVNNTELVGDVRVCRECLTEIADALQTRRKECAPEPQPVR